MLGGGGSGTDQGRVLSSRIHNHSSARGGAPAPGHGLRRLNRGRLDVEPLLHTQLAAILLANVHTSVQHCSAMLMSDMGQAEPGWR